jgi:hypothetical protein
MNRLLATLLLVTMLVGGLLALAWQRAEHRASTAERWTRAVFDSLVTTVSFPEPPQGLTRSDSLYWVWRATAADVQSRRWQDELQHSREQKRTLLDDNDLFELRRLGLADPVHQLRDSLVAHPELIPFPGTLGGTMHFIDHDAIVLLKPPFVFAEFEDGHIGGHMLVSYEVTRGPVVIWKRLWAELD